MNKRAQITIFIILAILIVIAIVLVFVLYERVIPEPPPNPIEEPERNIEQCVGVFVEEAVDKIIARGGYVDEPMLTKNFKGADITYLCFTASNNARCIMIEPVFIEHLEEEIYDYIEPEVENCFEKLEQELEEENYNVDIEEDLEFSVTLIPGMIKTKIKREVSISGKGKAEEFKQFESRFSTSLYDMAILIQEINRQEAIYCNSEYDDLMLANTWAKIEKFQVGDDKVYTVKDTRIDKEISFALRNCVLPVPS